MTEKKTIKERMAQDLEDLAKAEAPKPEEPAETKRTKRTCGVGGCERFVEVRKGTDVDDLEGIIKTFDASAVLMLPACKSADSKCLVQLVKKAAT